MKRSGMSSPTCCNLSHSQTFMIKINLSFWNYPALTDSSCCTKPSVALAHFIVDCISQLNFYKNFCHRSQRQAMGSVPEQEGLKMKRSGMSSPTCCNLSHTQTFMIKINFSFWNYPALTDSSCWQQLAPNFRTVVKAFSVKVFLLKAFSSNVFFMIPQKCFARVNVLSKRASYCQRRCNGSSGFREVHLKHIQANQFHFFAQT